MLEPIKRALVRTPLEPPLLALRAALRRLDRRRARELPEIVVEADRIDRWLRTTLRPNSNCLDVGCHIGGTLSLFMRLAPLGRHSAFEPVPEKARSLRRKFPEVEIHEVALADRSGRAEFFVNLSRPGFSGLRPHGGDRATRTITVDMRRLDDLIPTGQPVHLLKVDVEGAELAVLRGASGLLGDDRPLVLFECTASGLLAHDTKAADVFRFFHSLGYEILLPRTALEGGPPLDETGFLQAMQYPFLAFNFIARPAGEG